MEVIISILGIILTILFVIGTHEAAHFGVAKLLGVKVLRFSIGFGKPLWKCKDRQGTEYVIAPIPLGGYVQMLDEHEGAVAKEDLPYAYNRQPFYKKFLIVLAGPLSNLLCAFILYWLIFMIGFITIKPIIGNVTKDSIAYEAGLKSNQEIIAIDNHPARSWMTVVFRLLFYVGNPEQVVLKLLDRKTNIEKTATLNVLNWKINELDPDPLGSLGIIPYEPPVLPTIGTLVKNSPASKAGLKINDKIVSFDEQPFIDWLAFIDYIASKSNTSVQFKIIRDGKSLNIPVKVGTKHNWFLKPIGFLGVAPHFTWPPELLRHIHYGPLAAISPAFNEVVDFTYLNLVLFGKMITGKLSIQGLGGPITIFQGAGSALNSGLISFLGFLAFISIAIGVINFFPIPGLDGGHLLLQIIEAIIRRPISDNVLIFLYRFGFILLSILLIQSLTNDLLRLTY